MPNLFKEKIDGRESWSRIFQSAEAFEKLIKYIFKTHRLPFSPIEHCTPGTNAVFKVNDFIVKIFAPPESGFASDDGFGTEIFGLERAAGLGIPSPALAAKGTVDAGYRFDYMVAEYIRGKEFGKIENTFSDTTKIEIGRQLREITGKLNTECSRFNGIDVIKDRDRDERWNGFCDNFKNERLEYIFNHDFGRQVFVHGDLNPDNMLIGPENRLYIIDFADAVLAPREYELAAVVCGLFCFEKPYMRGYFGGSDAHELTGQCFDGIILHDYGCDMIRLNLGEIAEITDLKILRERLYAAISSGRQFPAAKQL